MATKKAAAPVAAPKKKAPVNQGQEPEAPKSGKDAKVETLEKALIALEARVAAIESMIDDGDEDDALLDDDDDALDDDEDDEDEEDEEEPAS